MEQTETRGARTTWRESLTVSEAAREAATDFGNRGGTAVRPVRSSLLPYPGAGQLKDFDRSELRRKLWNSPTRS